MPKIRYLWVWERMGQRWLWACATVGEFLVSSRGIASHGVGMAKRPVDIKWTETERAKGGFGGYFSSFDT